MRFVNDGFLVHMDAWGRDKNVASAKKAMALLLAGKDNKAGKLFIVSPTAGAGPLSSVGWSRWSSPRLRASTYRPASWTPRTGASTPSPAWGG